LERPGHGHRFLRCLDGKAIAPSTGREAVVKIPALSFQEELGFYARYVKSQGGTRLALNVFGPNAVARGLYESLDYKTMTIGMRKDLI
jgi:hypothetical protein